MTQNDPTRGSGSARFGSTVAQMTLLGLYAVVAAAALAWVDGLPTAVRVPLALPLLVFAPGYALVTALFPGGSRSRSALDEPRGEEGLRTGLAPLERASLGVVASIALVPAIAAVTNAVSGIYFAPIVAGVAAVTVLGCVVAAVRAPRSGVATRERETGLSPGDERGGRRWRDALTDGVTLVAVALTAMLLVSSAALAFTGDSGDSPRTEFYFADGASTDDGSVELAVQHHDDAEQTYTVVAMTADSPSDDGAAGSASERDRFSLSVGPDETATETYDVAGADLGDDSTLLFLLYRGDAPAEPDSESAHRQIGTSVNATGE